MIDSSALGSALRCALLVAPLIACERAPEGAAKGPGRDPYAPLAGGELVAAIANVRAAALGAPGTETDPTPILDRPHQKHLDAVVSARRRVRDAAADLALREDLAVAYTAAGRDDLARREYWRMLGVVPENPLVHLRYALATFSDARDAGTALRHVRIATGIGLPEPLAGEVAFLLGQVAEVEGQPQRAAEFYRAARARAPGNTEIEYRLGVLARDGGELEAARAAFEAVLELAPKHVPAHFALGQVLAKLNQPERSRELLLRHERLRQLEALGYLESSEAWQCIVLGNHHGRVGEYTAALAEFDRALALEPGNADARAFRAITLLQQGEHATALRELDALLVDAPDHVAALNALADFRLSSGPPELRDAAQAFSLAERAVAASKERDARSLSLLAEARAASGDRLGALEAARKARALEPDARAHEKLVAKLERGG